MKNKVLFFASLFIIASNSYCQTTTISDYNFEVKLISLGLDDVLDGAVLTESIDTVTVLSIDGSAIVSLEGIADFIALKHLSVAYNNIESLNLSSNSALEYVRIDHNLLTDIDVTGLVNLKELYCQWNALTALNVTTTVNLKNLYCDRNEIEFLDVSALINLDRLNCEKNELSELDLSNLTQLTYLICGRNDYFYIDFNANDSLEFLACRDIDALVELDLSDKPNLREVYCENENLYFLNLANGNPTVFDTLNVAYTPMLSCIQVDDPAYSETEWFTVATEDKYFSVDCGLSVKGNPLDAITVYVNQNRGVVVVENAQALAIGKLYNSAGQLVSTTSFNGTYQEINTGGLATGIYFLEVITADGRISQKLYLQ